MKLLKNYWKPTPNKWRKIGDALLAIAVFAAPYEIVTNNKSMAILFLVIGIAGKFLTNFFKEEK